MINQKYYIESLIKLKETNGEKQLLEQCVLHVKQFVPDKRILFKSILRIYQFAGLATSTGSQN